MNLKTAYYLMFQPPEMKTSDLDIDLDGTVQPLRAIFGVVDVPIIQGSDGLIIIPESEISVQKVYTSAETFRTSAVVLPEVVPRCTKIDLEVCPI